VCMQLVRLACQRVRVWLHSTVRIAAPQADSRRVSRRGGRLTCCLLCRKRIEVERKKKRQTATPKVANNDTRFTTLKRQRVQPHPISRTLSSHARNHRSAGQSTTTRPHWAVCRGSLEDLPRIVGQPLWCPAIRGGQNSSPIRLGSQTRAPARKHSQDGSTGKRVGETGGHSPGRPMAARRCFV